LLGVALMSDGIRVSLGRGKLQAFKLDDPEFVQQVILRVETLGEAIS